MKSWSLGVRAAAAIKKGGVFDVHKHEEIVEGALFLLIREELDVGF